MKCVVTGGAGFIGSHMTDRLLAMGNDVSVIDNFSTGTGRFLEQAEKKPGFELIEADLLNPGKWAHALKKWKEGRFRPGE